jgi:hypothetical protein
VVQQRKEARARTVESRRTRREELRRKILVGAVVLAKVEDGSLEEAALKAWLHPEGALALCEFNGCPGIAIDIPAAVSHAREAAQRGAFDAMIEIGPQVQASMIDPNEAVAWNLLATMLAQQGCTFGAFSPQWIAAATNTLTAKKSFDKARSLAEQYWRDYGAQIMSNIGCSS